MGEIDLKELRKQCLASLYLCTDNISKYVANEKQIEYDTLKSWVEKYCLLEAQQDVTNQALEKTKNEVNVENLDSLESIFKANLCGLAGKQLNMNNHPYMLEFNKRIIKGMQEATQKFDDSDIAITESQENYIDPITKRNIVDAARNSMCGHIYERNVIMDIIKKKKLRCPVAGCGNREPIQAGHLVSDDELRFRMTLAHHSTMLHERSTTKLDDTN